MQQRKKNIFLDRTFLIVTRPNILGFLYQNTVTVLIGILILLINDITLQEVFQEMLVKSRSLITFVAICGVVSVISFGFELFARPNPLLIPITPVSSMRQFKKEIAKIDLEENKFFNYVLPITVVSIGIFVFLVNLSDLGFSRVTLMTILAMLPFHLGVLMFHIGSIGLEILLLFLRYIIHR